MEESTGRPTRRSTGIATLEDVARRAAVSPQTVSRSIRSPHRVSADTLRRVRQAIMETGYVPNLAASHLASNRSKAVAVVIPSLSASVFAEAVDALDEVVGGQGYHLFIGTTDYRPDREQDLVRAFLGRRPDGFFVVGTQHDAVTRHLLSSAGVPVVEAWDLAADPVDSVVGFSNRDALAAMVELVVRKGYRRPVLAGLMREGDSRAEERRRGYEAAVRRLLPGEDVRVVGPRTGEAGLETGRLLLDQVLRRHPDTDVMVCTSDVYAAGALLECQRRGISVPATMAIAGFGDFEIGRHLVPRLTTVAAPNRQIGVRAGELLLSRMSGESEDPQVVDLGYSITVRESL